MPSWTPGLPNIRIPTTTTYGTAHSRPVQAPTLAPENQDTEKKTESVKKRILAALAIIGLSTGIGALAGIAGGPKGVILGAGMGFIFGVVAVILRDTAINCNDSESDHDTNSGMLHRQEIN